MNRVGEEDGEDEDGGERDDECRRSGSIHATLGKEQTANASFEVATEDRGRMRRRWGRCEVETGDPDECLGDAGCIADGGCRVGIGGALMSTRQALIQMAGDAWEVKG